MWRSATGPTLCCGRTLDSHEMSSVVRYLGQIAAEGWFKRCHVNSTKRESIGWWSLRERAWRKFRLKFDDDASVALGIGEAETLMQPYKRSW